MRGHPREADRAPPKRAAPFACRLVIMAKLPVAGQVKTRLAREIGHAEATRFYRATARAVLMRLARQPFWRTCLAVSPDTGVASPMLPGGIRRMAQGSGDLGARMHRPMRLLPPGPVCVIGTDIPAIRPSDIRRAFSLLGRCGAVFGPAEDGGFWLVGMRRRPRLIYPYGSVAWSRPDTLAAVEANLDRQLLRVGRTTRHFDVDSRRDLARFDGLFGRVVLPLASGGLSASNPLQERRR
ncbi:MAG: glycosyltransferase [Hyphomicrobiaceae bacterium]